MSSIVDQKMRTLLVVPHNGQITKRPFDDNSLYPELKNGAQGYVSMLELSKNKSLVIWANEEWLSQPNHVWKNTINAVGTKLYAKYNPRGYAELTIYGPIVITGGPTDDGNSNHGLTEQQIEEIIQLQ
jgi:hypothetical protein